DTVVRAERNWSPEVCFNTWNRPFFYDELEIRWHDTNDGDTISTEHNILANNTRIGSKAALPEAMTQDSHPRLPCLAFLGCKVATYHRIYPENREEIRTYPLRG